ncbi:MAG: PhzF family phenazine biosynthesis protein [bacterium]
MKLPIYQIDAFTSKVFSGNPAAVCPLEQWIDDTLMQAIAEENNLSETAFFVPAEGGYHIRWFTPVAEIGLCGHATLAAAFVIFTFFDLPGQGNEIVFFSRSGELKVTQQSQGMLAMDFPSLVPALCSAIPQDLLEGLGKEPREVLCTEDFMAVFPCESDIGELKPDMEKLRKLGLRGVIITAQGDEADFVSRFFAPRFGIDEDAVTGSAHCSLIPFWARRLNKKSLYARQLSRRGGELYCMDRGDRVIISGRAVKYMEGTITI